MSCIFPSNVSSSLNSVSAISLKSSLSINGANATKSCIFPSKVSSSLNSVSAISLKSSLSINGANAMISCIFPSKIPPCSNRVSAISFKPSLSINGANAMISCILIFCLFLSTSFFICVGFIIGAISTNSSPEISVSSPFTNFLIASASFSSPNNSSTDTPNF